MNKADFKKYSDKRSKEIYKQKNDKKRRVKATSYRSINDCFSDCRLVMVSLEACFFR